MSTNFFVSSLNPLRHAPMFSGFSPTELYRLKGTLTASQQEWLVDEHQRLSQIEALTRQLIAELSWSVTDVDCRNQAILDKLKFLLN
jgi:hypothetical protein